MPVDCGERRDMNLTRLDRIKFSTETIRRRAIELEKIQRKEDIKIFSAIKQGWMKSLNARGVLMVEKEVETEP